MKPKKKKLKPKTVSLTKLRKEADKAFYKKVVELNDGICEICGATASTAHHFILKSRSSLLRYELKNGIAICNSCHCKHHQAADPSIHYTIIKKRGNEWAEEMMRLSHIINRKYKGKEYYKNIIKELECELLK